MPDDCLFCRIVRGEIPATIVATTARCIAFHDVGPQAPTHALVIPRDHVATLNDVTDASVIGEMASLAVQVARNAGIAETGYRVVINTNADGGQSVFHVHMHVLGGRHLAWPPG